VSLRRRGLYAPLKTSVKAVLDILQTLAPCCYRQRPVYLVVSQSMHAVATTSSSRSRSLGCLVMKKEAPASRGAQHVNQVSEDNHCDPRSGRMARCKGSSSTYQHLAPAVAAAITRAERTCPNAAPVHQRHCRPLLRRLERTHRTALEDHAFRTPLLGCHQSDNLRVGIMTTNQLVVGEMPWWGH